MTLADGTPIASRFGTKEYYLFKGRVDHDFAAYSLKIYANEKGVVVKSYNVTEQGVSVIVDWK
ncbi:MAG TPA: hypothetical protein VFM18_14245 [Methanosarcina sp.]|nr:hypothetical protein [Methanosarcina sp.]